MSPASLRGRFSKAGELLNAAIDSHAFPGAVLAIGYQQETAIIPAGHLSYDAGAALVTPDTIYDLASLTKVLATTTAAMILLERGSLRLEAPLAQFLPDFVPPYDLATDPLWSARPEVTIRDLLTHQSGLPAYERFYVRAREKKHVVEEALTVPLEDAPGQRTIYSDIGFILLGQVLELVSKETLDSFCAREIFAPLLMPHTCFNPNGSLRLRIAPTEVDDAFRHRLIWGEVHDENAWVMGGVAGHAGLFGTAADLAAFCRMMLHQGESDGRRLLQASTISQFTRAYPARAGFPRALGWDKPSFPSSSGRYFSPASYGHLGYTGTSIWIDPEKSLFVILLTNRVHPSRENRKIEQVRPAVHDAVVESLALAK